jgi:hypothetical protein
MLGEGIQGSGCGVRLCTRQKEAATRLRWRRAIEAWDPRHHTRGHGGVMCGVIELCERWREQSLARCLASLEQKRGGGEVAAAAFQSERHSIANTSHNVFWRSIAAL